MKNKKLVIFDMDGTIIDSSSTIANAINHVRSYLGLEKMTNEHIISHVNDHTIEPARFFYGMDRFEPLHEKLFSEYYKQNHANELKLYEGINDMLHSLYERKIPMALATNGYRGSTIDSLAHFGLGDLFDHIVCADDVMRGKPAPDMLFKILDDSCLTSREAVFVGDGPRDQQAAQAAGMDYLMVDWGFTQHDKDVGAIKNVKELKSRFGMMLNPKY